MQVISCKNFQHPFDSKSSNARITQAVEQASNPCAGERKQRFLILLMWMHISSAISTSTQATKVGEVTGSG